MPSDSPPSDGAPQSAEARWEQERERRRSHAAALFEAALWELADDTSGALEPALDSGLQSLRDNVTDRLSMEEQAIVHVGTTAPQRSAYDSVLRCGWRSSRLAMSMSGARMANECRKTATFFGPAESAPGCGFR